MAAEIALRFVAGWPLTRGRGVANLQVLIAAEADPGEVARVMRSAQRYGVTVDAVMLTQMMQAYALAGDTRAAWREWSYFRRRGAEPDAVAFGTIIGASFFGGRFG
jgi:hypothetical protein